MVDVLIAEAAGEDYAGSLIWYAERSHAAAERFEVEFHRALQVISAHPDRYPHCDDLHRYYLMQGYPFQIIYRMIGEDLLQVVAVAHTSRRPGYWKKG